MGLAGCPARQPARPGAHRVPKALFVVPVFSFRLLQPSLGQVAFSILAFSVSQHGREHRGALHVLSQCCGIHFNLPLPSVSVKESRLFKSRLRAASLPGQSDRANRAFGTASPWVHFSSFIWLQRLPPFVASA